MGYNLEAPWDLDELKKQNIPQIAPMVGSSTSFGDKTRIDYFVDLELGRFSSPKDGFASKFKVSGGYQMDSPSRGSSRKARARSNGTQIVSCSVDGCGSDLSTCRDYHRRHKVCEVHSKTAIVTIGGLEKRFCQQCSRFHSLAEFDEGKRSCRKRLDGHNRRRRKSHPESISVDPKRFLYNCQDARYLAFRDPQATGSVSSSVWSGIVKAENDPILYSNNQSLISFSDRKNPFPGSLSQFPFLLGTGSTLPEDSETQPILDPNSALGNGGSNQKMFFDRALSLLSSPPAKTREVGFGHFTQPNPIPPLHSSIPGTLHYNSLRPQVELSRSGMVPDTANQHFPTTFHIGLDGSSATANLPHQTLSFSWK